MSLYSTKFDVHIKHRAYLMLSLFKVPFPILLSLHDTCHFDLLAVFAKMLFILCHFWPIHTHLYIKFKSFLLVYNGCRIYVDIIKYCRQFSLLTWTSIIVIQQEWRGWCKGNGCGESLFKPAASSTLLDDKIQVIINPLSPYMI